MVWEVEPGMGVCVGVGERVKGAGTENTETENTEAENTKTENTETLQIGHIYTVSYRYCSCIYGKHNDK